MGRNWNDITNEVITNHYLYGQEDKPDNLVDKSLISVGDPKICK